MYTYICIYTHVRNTQISMVYTAFLGHLPNGRSGALYTVLTYLRVAKRNMRFHLELRKMEILQRICRETRGVETGKG